MDFSDMTPDEIRAYAARKEAVELHRSHIDASERRDPAPVVSMAKPWEREVEVDGTSYTVDMRRFKSRRFMRMAMIAGGEGASFADQLDLFDYVFEPVEAQILAKVEHEVGYEDFEAYYDICAKIFEAVEGKN